MPISSTYFVCNDNNNIIITINNGNNNNIIIIITISTGAKSDQTTGRDNYSAMGERKTAGMGCDRAGHFCRRSCDQFSQGSRSGGKTRSYQ